jgi:integrase
MEEGAIVATGNDRGVSFEDMKNKFINHINKLYINYKKPHTIFEKKILVHKLCYMMIAIIQLRNGSRISEAISAFKQYVSGIKIDEKVIVKIAKSEGKQYSRNQKKMIDKKIRHRKMVFATWIPINIFYRLMKTKREIMITMLKGKRVEGRVFDYMNMNFDSNTHSLRYACINYLLTEKKLPMPTVAKYVGHINTNELVRYTQNKEVDKIFDLDI